MRVFQADNIALVELYAWNAEERSSEEFQDNIDAIKLYKKLNFKIFEFLNDMYLMKLVINYT